MANGDEVIQELYNLGLMDDFDIPANPSIAELKFIEKEARRKGSTCSVMKVRTHNPTRWKNEEAFNLTQRRVDYYYNVRDFAKDRIKELEQETLVAVHVRHEQRELDQQEVNELKNLMNQLKGLS